MLKYLVRNTTNETNHVKWNVVIPPGYDTYSIESTHGFLFNQISISDQDVIEIETNLEEQIQISFTYETYTDDLFQGVYDKLEDVKFVDQFTSNKIILIRKSDTSIRYDAYEYNITDHQFHLVREARFLGSQMNVYRNDNTAFQNTSVLYDELKSKEEFCYGDFYFDISNALKVYINKYNGSDIGFHKPDTNENFKFGFQYIIRLYKSFYTDEDFAKEDTFDADDPRAYEKNENGVDLYNLLLLKEIVSFPKIILNLHDYIENEYDELLEDKNKTFIKLLYEPSPFFIYQSGQKGTIIKDKPLININSLTLQNKIGDMNRRYFRIQQSDDSNPITFNSSITTQIRKNKRQTVESVGVQEVKGSSLFDQFIQTINLHLASFLHNYWIGSENEYDDEHNIIYYRCIGMIKFYAGETSNLTNFVNTVVPIKRTDEAQDTHIYGNHYINSSNDSHNDYDNRMTSKILLASLFNTESLKLGNADSRIVYPVGIMKQFLLTGPEYKKRYHELFKNWNDEAYDTKKIEYIINNTQSPFKITNVKISNPLSYQLLSQKGGNCEIAISASEAIIHNNKITESKIKYNVEKEGLKFAQTVDSLGFFKLWSPELYITVNDSSGLSICTNVDNDKMISLNNVVWMFTQTATGFNWMSNALPFSKINITEGKRLEFTLYDFCGRTIPLIDSSSGLKNDLHLEITLYKNPETAQKE